MADTQRILPKDLAPMVRSMGTRIRMYYKSKGSRFHSSISQKIRESVGLSPEDFRAYIASKFTDGMSWDNHGEWHLDHIVPISSARNEDDMWRLNHYTNLQPLWAKDNIAKGAKLDYEAD